MPVPYLGNLAVKFRKGLPGIRIQRLRHEFIRSMRLNTDIILPAKLKYTCRLFSGKGMLADQLHTFVVDTYSGTADIAIPCSHL